MASFSGTSDGGRRPRVHSGTRLYLSPDGSRGERLAQAALFLLIVAIAAGLVYLAIHFLGRAFFTKNPEFVIARIVIDTDELVPVERARKLSGLSEGVNAFDIDLPKIRDNIVSNEACVKTVEIARRLPDEISLKIRSRVPVATVYSAYRLVVDAEGNAFRLPEMSSYKLDTMPLISNLGRPPRPGEKISESGMKALRTINVGEVSQLAFRVAEVDVSNEHYLIIVSDSPRREIMVPWECVGADEEISMILRKVSRAMRSAEGRMKGRFIWDGVHGTVNGV